jgi:hypothetical protein
MHLRGVAACYGDNDTENRGQRHWDGEGNRDARRSSVRPATWPRGPLPVRHAIHLHIDKGEL